MYELENGKMDLRKTRTQKLIQDTFKEMLCEMDIERITVKELTDRAMINRKTFYFHYDTIEQLVDLLLEQVTREYINTFERLPEGRPHEDANAVFFRFFSNQPDWFQKIINYPSYSSLCNQVFDKAYYHALEKTPNPDWKRLPQSVQNMIAIYYRSATLDLYRQWHRERERLTIDDAIFISNNLICNGANSVDRIISGYLK